MSTIITRIGKGSPLTNVEVDTNFTNLNTDKLEAATTATLTNKTINLTSNTLVATSAQIAAAVTDETGTGSLVFANSPTLVTPALGTPASGVVTNLTGTASININGTVGATTASTGAFTTLAYTGTLTGGTGVINIGSGQLYKDASGNVGIGTSSPGATASSGVSFVPGSTTFGVFTGSNGTGSIRLINNGGGSNLTADTICGNISFFGRFNGTLSGANDVSSIRGVYTGNGTTRSGDLRFLTINNGSEGERMRIDSAGNVGIGTSSPLDKLGVFGSGSTTGIAAAEFGYSATTQIAARIAIQDWGGVTQSPVLDLRRFTGTAQNHGTARIGCDASANLRFFTNLQTSNTPATTERMRITSAGNVGIGTSSPAASGRATLQVENASLSQSSSDVSNLHLMSNAYRDSENAYRYISTGFAARYQHADGRHLWFTAVSGTAGNTVSFTERMVIDSAGNVGIGTTSPTEKLQVAGSIRVTSNASDFNVTGGQFDFITDTVRIAAYNSAGGYVTFYTNASGGSVNERARITPSGDLLVGKTSSAAETKGCELRSGFATLTSDADVALFLRRNTNNGDIVQFRSAAALVGSISVTGSATAYNTSSDYRLKNTVAPITGALAKVALLKPCTYKWNADGSDGEGFIAHELAEVVPQCVTGQKDAVDAEGKPQYQGIDTSFLVATLTAALQEAVAEINSLKARLDAANL
jgi:hypothetical protein